MDAALKVALFILGLFLFVWGLIPIWPGLSGSVPIYAYPLGIACSVVGLFGVTEAVRG